MKMRLFVMLTLLVASSALLPAQSDEVTIPAGTALRVRLENRVGSDLSRVEDAVRARLVNPIVLDGRTVVPAGGTVLGSVTQAVRSGRVKGRARIGMRFHTLVPAGDDERYRIGTRTWTAVAPATKKNDVATIGLPAAGGAIVGGVMGGQKRCGDWRNSGWRRRYGCRAVDERKGNASRSRRSSARPTQSTGHCSAMMEKRDA